MKDVFTTCNKQLHNTRSRVSKDKHCTPYLQKKNLNKQTTSRDLNPSSDNTARPHKTTKIRLRPNCSRSIIFLGSNNPPHPTGTPGIIAIETHPLKRSKFPRLAKLQSKRHQTREETGKARNLRRSQEAWVVERLLLEKGSLHQRRLLLLLFLIELLVPPPQCFENQSSILAGRAR